MKLFQRIEDFALRGAHIFWVKHEAKFRIAERSLERLVERKTMRAIDWIIPPWKKRKVLTRYVEPDTRPVKDVN